jgi:hypothetical protein
MNIDNVKTDLEKLHNLNDSTLLNNPHELSEIMTKYDSDKGAGLSIKYISNNEKPPNSVCHNYTWIYQEVFKNIRNEQINIFEMGVGVPNCMGSWAGSLKGWKEYFPNSIIHSADFDKDFLYNDDRITSYYVDQEDEESIKNMWGQIGDVLYDIMIDDGPHTESSNYLFYINSIHKLKSGGVYIIEDINLDFIDNLDRCIKEYNSINSVEMESVKLIINYPPGFTHPVEVILKMNNMLILQKK